MDFFSPPPSQSFTEQLQGAVTNPSPTMNLFSTSPAFTFNPGNMALQGESGGAVSGIYPDQFMGASASHEDFMGMDTDDPILNSLQTLAEGTDFGEQMGEPQQNFNVWEWFEQQ
jgi:hypothetical protein